MIRSCVLLMALALAARAAVARPCEACARGDALIDRYGIGPVRELAGELAKLTLTEPLTPEQYARVVELRNRAPALSRLGALDDAELELVAAAVCRDQPAPCASSIVRALRCLAERCAVALPDPDPDRADLVELPERCKRPITHRRSPRLGLGFDWGNGWQRSQYPNDGRTFSVGIDARARLSRRFGLVARVDRTAGRDEALDLDDNGKDDNSTGSIVRVVALAGPSVLVDYAPFSSTTRFVRIDLLGGYLSTRSQPAESGPAAGVDLAFHLSILRAGVRVVQGFGDARDATMVLGHLGIAAGSAPQYTLGGHDCTGADSRSSRLALGLDIPVGGWGISSQHGYLATGLGIEAAWFLSPTFDAIARADLLLFPRYERDRAIHQAVLAGARIDHAAGSKGRSRNGWFTTVLGGYSHGAGVRPTKAGPGPIVDVSLGWGRQSGEGAGYVRLHARFGVTPDNLDYRAVFLSAGLELRLEPNRWRARL